MIYQIILIGISLSLDAMCVSIAIGLQTKRRVFATLSTSAIIFGLFQGIMPVLGYYPMRWVTSVIDLSMTDIIAGIILAGVGIHMIFAEFRTKEASKSQKSIDHYNFPTLILLGIATSIDALAVGLSFGCTGKQNIGLDAIIIGFITAAICMVAGIISNRSADPMLSSKKAGIIGGTILILLAIKIVILG